MPSALMGFQVTKGARASILVRARVVSGHLLGYTRGIRPAASERRFRTSVTDNGSTSSAHLQARQVAPVVGVSDRHCRQAVESPAEGREIRGAALRAGEHTTVRPHSCQVRVMDISLLGSAQLPARIPPLVWLAIQDQVA
jgi:hypothetical protein